MTAAFLAHPTGRRPACRQPECAAAAAAGLLHELSRSCRRRALVPCRMSWLCSDRRDWAVPAAPAALAGSAAGSAQGGGAGERAPVSVLAKNLLVVVARGWGPLGRRLAARTGCGAHPQGTPDAPAPRARSSQPSMKTLLVERNLWATRLFKPCCHCVCQCESTACSKRLLQCGRMFSEYRAGKYMRIHARHALPYVPNKIRRQSTSTRTASQTSICMHFQSPSISVGSSWQSQHPSC